MKLIVSGIILHLILISSIFDIYFTSPIIQGMSPQKCNIKAPAKRLVLVVADGLRQESLYGPDISNSSHFENMAPFLSSLVASKQASWGISHTRVPTESRPGHVAITAGFYEDPSAIAKGWKENPVDFDSVFNQSYHTWAWGSPDIVPMFSKSPNVRSYSYSPEEEDFSGKMSTSLLDVWVFDKLTKFFSDPHVDKLNVRNHQVIFFLHLLGLDSAGHTHKPYSKEHTYNIKVVDDGIKGVVKTFEQFYSDNDTAYIFTADHGMTDWGSHGAGSAAETETPFIFWGPGIKTSITPMAIEQADLAPLISTLIGIPIPVNSVGVLPDFSLNLPPKDLASAMFTNALQIFMQYHVKRTRTLENSLRIFYKEFPGFSPEEFDHLFLEIERSMVLVSFEQAIELSKQLILYSQQGLAYYHNYYQRLLLTFVSLAYIGWIVLLILYVVGFTIQDIQYFSLTHIGLLLTMFITCAILFAQSLPVTYYIYCLIPQYIWWKILTMIKVILPRVKLLWCDKLRLSVVIKITIYSIVGVEILVMSFFRREALGIALVVISVWPYNLRRVHVFFKICWTLTSLSLAVFPFLPVVGTTFNFYLVAVTGVIWVFTHVILLYGPVLWLGHRIITPNHQLLAGCLQSVCVALAVGNLFLIDNSMANKSGLTTASQISSWTLTGFSLCLPFFGSTFIFERLINITMGCLVPFILMSVSYEPVFMLVLFLNLLLWLSIENAQFTTTGKYLFTIPFGKDISPNTLSNYRTSVVIEDVRRSFFILLFAVLAFFGMGNMASLNSFDPMWVRSYITVFSPFLMAALILFKILIPYIVVSCVFRAIATCLEATMKKIFYIVLILCDTMGLHFLFMVQNTGSWLEIGSSISHFIIVQTMVLFLLLLYGVAFVLTEYTIIEPSKYVRLSYLKLHVP